LRSVSRQSIYPIMTDSNRSRTDLGEQTVQKMIEFIRCSGFFYTYFRMFSRNIYKRAAENEKYMRILGSWRNKVANEKNLAGQRKYYHFYKCPECGQRIRIPKGHGKIQIRCPKCNATFIRRS
jgi:DNA-directed RNA polymerase subunit RPC12/RpoP